MASNEALEPLDTSSIQLGEKCWSGDTSARTIGMTTEQTLLVGHRLDAIRSYATGEYTTNALAYEKAVPPTVILMDTLPLERRGWVIHDRLLSESTASVWNITD